MKSLLALVLLAVTGRSQGHVLVVDAAGGGAYTQIGTALQSASAGDVLLVKSGSYAAFAVANQSVAIVGDAHATVQINGTVQVRNLAAGRSALLHRLQAFGALSVSTNDGPGITLKNDLGAVRVQDCLAQGAAGQQGVRVEGCGDIALVMTQGLGGIAWPQSGAGVLANGTAIALYECDLQGAAGAAPVGGNPPGCSGGHAGSALVSSVAGFVFVGGTLLIGGTGADAANGCMPVGSSTCDGGNGGSGISVVSGVQTLWQLSNAAQPGSGGAGGHGNCGCGLFVWCDGEPGYPGVGVASGPGDTLVSLSGASPTLSLSANPARENTSLGIGIDSAPGDAVLLVISGAVGFSPEQDRGVRLVDWSGPHTTRRLGTTDAQGHLQTSWAIADLGPGIESQIVHLQVLVVQTNGQRRWSNPVSLVLLDGAF